MDTPRDTRDAYTRRKGQVRTQRGGGEEAAVGRPRTEALGETKAAGSFVSDF